MSKTATTEILVFSLLLQTGMLALKLTGIVKLSWMTTLSPTLLPLTAFIVILISHVVKKSAPARVSLSYTSKKWQEKLAEVNYSRSN